MSIELRHDELMTTGGAAVPGNPRQRVVSRWRLLALAIPLLLGLAAVAPPAMAQQGQQKLVQLIVRLPPAAKAGKDIRMVVDQNQPLQAAIGQCNEFGCLVRG